MELLNVYDAEGRVVGAKPRREAKESGLAVGAVNLLLLRSDGAVLLQRRPADKENGGRWDKSVGGHVSAGEDFDQTVVREAREELFDDPNSPAVLLAEGAEAFRRKVEEVDLTRHVLLHRAALQLNLRDVRLRPGDGLRRVVYHVAVYLGRTDLAREGFRPQASEIDDLRYFTPGEVDRMLVDGQLAPNMGFLWLTQARALLSLGRAGLIPGGAP